MALGNSAPINYAAVFRVYDQSTAGVLLWSESQIITVDKGLFSVILGQGSANGSEPRPALSSVFAPSGASTWISDRYIAINVTIGGVATEIQPRLRLVPNAYAFTARNANNVIDANGTAVLSTAVGRVGINKVPTTALDVNGTVTATSFSGSASGLTGLVSSQIPSLDADKITSGTVADARLSDNVALLNRSPQAFSGSVNSFSGSVGINTTTPTGKLQVNGGVAITGASSPYAVGTAGLFMEYSSGVANLFAYDYGSGGGGKTLSLNGPGGNVGIGTTTPTHVLQVNGALASRQTTSAYGYIGMHPGSSSTQGYVEWFKPGPTRVAYMGYSFEGTVDSLGLILENGANFAITGGSTIARGNMYVDGYIYNKWGGTYYALFNGGGQNNTVLWNTSDARLKKDQATIIDALGTLGRLRGVTYHWNEEGLAHLTRDIKKTWRSASGTDADNQKLWAEKRQEALETLHQQQTGFIAQEVEQVFPGWVRTDEKGYKQIKLEQLTGVLVQAVNELHRKSETASILSSSATQELTRKLEAQESELTELRTELSRIRDEKNSLAANLYKLEARDEAREARLARIEKALEQQAAIRQAKATTRE